MRTFLAISAHLSLEKSTFLARDHLALQPAMQPTLLFGGVGARHAFHVPLDLLPGIAARTGRDRQVLDLPHAADDVLQDLPDAILELQLHERLADLALDSLACLV